MQNWLGVVKARRDEKKPWRVRTAWVMTRKNSSEREYMRKYTKLIYSAKVDLYFSFFFAYIILCVCVFFVRSTFRQAFDTPISSASDSLRVVERSFSNCWMCRRYARAFFPCVPRFHWYVYVYIGNVRENSISRMYVARIYGWLWWIDWKKLLLSRCASIKLLWRMNFPVCNSTIYGIKYTHCLKMFAIFALLKIT